MSKNRLGKTPLFRDSTEDRADKQPEAIETPTRKDVETLRQPNAQTSKQSNAKYKTQKKMTIYVPEELARRIKILVARTDRDISEYAAEGFESVLKKYE